MSKEDNSPSSTPDQVSSNKRIAKNTLMLYLRMLLSTMVSVYTSRVVLQVLGVDDYGIYGLVGGIVGLFSFLNSSMAGATSRFLTYELGRGERERLLKTFSSAIIVHIIVAVIVFILAETVGLWFLCNRLVIPSGRMLAAHVVYQASVLSTMVGITQVPYNSSLVAHEKFDMFAYMEILNVSLKLLIVYLLQIVMFDKLIVYSMLVLAVSLFISFIYYWYCHHHFAECKLYLKLDKEYIKPMLSFSILDLYGNGCVAISQQGLNFLVNIFFGVALNAASSLAATVSGMVGAMTSNVLMAYRPVIIKLYAQGLIEKMEQTILTALKFISLIFACCAIPLVIEVDCVFQLWLGQVPPHAVGFCQAILAFNIFSLLSLLPIIAIHATGRIKLLSFLSGTLLLSALPLQYVVYRLDCSPESAYVIRGAIYLTVLIADFLIAKHNIPSMRLHIQFEGICRVLIVVAVAYVIAKSISLSFSHDILGVLVVTLANIIIVAILGYLLLFNKYERKIVVNRIKGLMRNTKK